MGLEAVRDVATQVSGVGERGGGEFSEVVLGSAGLDLSHVLQGAQRGPVSLLGINAHLE